MQLQALFLAIVAIIATVDPMVGQTLGTSQALTAAEQVPWAAIGQITYGNGMPSAGGAICTGTLVAADLVLTAGHCVSDGRVTMPAGDVQFNAGWRAGASLATRRGRAIILAGSTYGQPKDLSQDVALLVLDTPIEAQDIRPLPLSRPGLLSEIYTLIGYRRAAPDSIYREDDCTLLKSQPALLMLGCAVVSGNSGAPILRKQSGVWQVAAVMVAAARGGGLVRSYAIIPGDDLRARIAAP